jgi:hypothetical protein
VVQQPVDYWAVARRLLVLLELLELVLLAVLA